MYYFDSHCHLQDERIKNLAEQIIEQARNDGVTFMLCCGSCESDWEDVAILARKWKQVIPAFGIHPWNVTTRSSYWQERLCSYLHEFPEAAVGEIGLDHIHETENKEEQLKVFALQIEIAQQLKRSVSVHCLKAWGDLLSAFSSMKKLPKYIAFHSFSGSAETMHILEKMGCYFSCSGSVTHDKNKRIRSIVREIPLDKILLETDTPDLPPDGYSGYTVPSLIKQITTAVATLRNIDAEQMALLTYKNACTCFRVVNG
jgi:TatD DNase family protein